MNRLNEIEARTNAATEGPWEAKSETPTMAGAVWNLRITGKPGIRMNVTEWQHGMENAEFIAHARTDVPDMAAALRAVLEIHQDGGESQGYLDDGSYGDMPNCCTECGSFGEYGVPYPCRTVAAIRHYLGDDL